ncbi:uncharacterized protein I303_107864 [Kwoniella dejecticola CBS 10117]|uniref:BCAS3 WD40 domain-containing protein n=1 Tax=Kwoniella dejecticola CBS 10117 TaxID=1296121 RepID=A0A1A5ZVX4_9TREE|nr:uncharacterized protein I303_07867 [Kwoniella dejecticola CBS 10117]OBR81954.1 hypothetical protein I303_07867 [Kwoniella dejecticola CBS 10117]
MSHLPSLAGMTSLKGFLPASPTKVPSSAATTGGNVPSKSDEVKSIWQEGDIGDGKGKRPLLLVTSRTHALQVFAFYNSVIPDDPHIPETFPAPEEVVSLPSIKYSKNVKRTSIDGIVDTSNDFRGVEQILSMTLLESRSEQGGLLVAAVVLSPSTKQSAKGWLGLVVIDLNTGSAIQRIELGPGNLAKLHSTPKTIAISVSDPVSAIHLFDSITFTPLPCSPIMGSAVHPHTGLPVIALSNRLLAFATSEAPRAPGPDGLGTIITSSTLRPPASRPSSSERQRPLSSANNDAQAAILSSAVGIGGGVARGVWAGLKMGARAANRARNTRLAKSAPSDSSGIMVDEEVDDVEAESRSLEESSILEERPLSAASTSYPTKSGGEWIKIVDLHPKRTARSRTRKVNRSHSSSQRRPETSADEHSIPIESYIETVAHFRLPPSSSSLPIDPLLPNQPRRSSNNRSHPVVSLAFSPDGTQIFAAPSDGRSLHILEVHPAGLDKADIRSDVTGQVWHPYELKRGHTPADVREVMWDRNGRWIGVGTGKGTVHVFPINPSGGLPSASTHATAQIINASQLQPLSTTTLPIARLRPRRMASDTGNASSPDNLARSAEHALFMFSSHRRHPTRNTTFCQDIPIYRASANTLELARVSASPVEHKKSADDEGHPRQRRGSALTEMMKTRAFGDGSDLSTEAVVRAAWSLPEPSNDRVLLDALPEIPRPRDAPQRAPRSKSLAHAEIRTHHISPSILPSSIYLSRQVEFFSVIPIDEYSPLSILDLEARQHKFQFREEVKAFSPVPEHIKPFDEPLLSALHSIMEETPITQLPGLPNGTPHSRWTPTRIPIRSVTSGIGEGMERVKREYVRAQHSRSKHRKNQKEESTGLGLSFEDSDSISLSHPSLSSSNDSPLSEVLPTTTTSSSNTEPSEEDEEWGLGWEEEYNKAIEDDTPQELVLGLMDEEEEERRKWEIRRERMKKEYSTAK